MYGNERIVTLQKRSEKVEVEYQSKRTVNCNIFEITLAAISATHVMPFWAAPSFLACSSNRT